LEGVLQQQHDITRRQKQSHRLPPLLLMHIYAAAAELLMGH
jgi:hypothetical protein